MKTPLFSRLSSIRSSSDRPAAAVRYASTVSRRSSVVTVSTRGCSGASTMKVAPHRVSGRVVNTTMSSGRHRRGDGDEGDFGAFGSPDPVALHDRIGSGQSSAPVLQQFVGVLGDGKEPLLHHHLDDGLLVALVLAVDDLLVGEDGLERGRPVDHRLARVGDVVLEHLLEEPLGPLVVRRV